MNIKSRKILIFSLSFFPFIGGAEVALQEITKRIDGREFDIITARFDKALSERERIGNVNIFRVGNGNRLDKYLYPIKAFLFSQKLHKKNDYDLVWAMMASWAGIPALLFKIFNKNIKYLLTLQSGDSHLFLWIRVWFWYPVYRMIYTKADHIQVISKWLAKRARNFGYKKEISVVPNGVDLVGFESKANIDLNFKKDNIRVLTVSRLVKKNGVGNLIRAVDLLVKKYKLPVVLKIVGVGKLERKLKNLVNELDLQNRIVFLGKIEYKKVREYYKQADIFVRPSLSEGFGNVFIEAMAAGIPVVATPVGGILDFLQDEETGWMCEVENPKSVADKIGFIIDEKNSEKVFQIVQKAQEMVRKKYSWNFVACEMNKLFEMMSCK